MKPRIFKMGRKKMKYKRSQILSFDLLLAVAIFVVVLSLFFVFFSSKMDEMPEAQLKKDVVVFKNLISANSPDEETPVTLIVQNKLDYNKLVNLAKQLYENPESYEEIKAQLNVGSDFCIFFEDNDGGIQPLIVDQTDDGNTIVVYGVSNPELNFNLGKIGDVTIICGQPYVVNADGSLTEI